MALTIADILRAINPNIGVIANVDGETFRIGVEDVNSDEILAALMASGVDLAAILIAVGDVPLTYSAPATANAGVASTQLVAANANRRYLSIVNNSDTAIYLGIEVDAVLNSGTRINASGGSKEFIRGVNLTTQVVNGIHGGAGNKNVTVQEAV